MQWIAMRRDVCCFIIGSLLLAVEYWEWKSKFDCLLNHLFRRYSKKTSKFRVTGLCDGNSPGTGKCFHLMTSSWRYHNTFGRSGFYVAKVISNTMRINTGRTGKTRAFPYIMSSFSPTLTFCDSHNTYITNQTQCICLHMLQREIDAF